MTKEEITVEMPYIGGVLSTNRYKTALGITRRQVQNWMDELGWLVKSAHIEDWKLPLTVTCSGQFKDRRSVPDLSNLSKVILDALEDVSGVNDRDMRWRDGYIEIAYDKEPTLFITIEGGK